MQAVKVLGKLNPLEKKGYEKSPSAIDWSESGEGLWLSRRTIEGANAQAGDE